MPNLGQGGCQAIEDVKVLADELCSITDKSQISEALQSYYRQRIVRSAIVQGMSRASSDIIISQFSTPFSLGEFLKRGWNYKYLTWPSLMTWNMRRMLPMLFYAQFGYLYSYAPSAFNTDRIKQLVKNARERNKAEAEKIYGHVTADSVTYFSAKTMSFMKYNKRSKSTSKIADATEFRSQLKLGT